MAAAPARKGTFSGASVYLSRNLVPPEVFDAVHDALRLNGADVVLCCDPSRNSPSDYHVISSPDHEKFDDLKSKGCNLLGPQCILSCAKERRSLPKQGYTCCLALDGVKMLASGFGKEEKVKIEKLVTAMGGILQNKTSLDINFVIVKNVLAAKYKWALNVLKKPIVNLKWLSQCWTEHRVVPQEPYRVLPFTGLTISVTKLPLAERREIQKLVVQNGGNYSADLTRACTHLVSNSIEGDKYMVALKWGHIHIVNRKWVDQSIAKRGCLDERAYPLSEASKSCNGKKSLQKQQGYQESNSLSSQPSRPTVIEDLEATLSQNVTSTFSDVTKINNEDTSTPKEQMKDEVKNDYHVAEDSEREDNDLYLSNCRILLVGFEEKEQRKLINMIRKGGGTQHRSLSEKLTHIILGAPSESEKRDIRSLAALGVINVVTTMWLENCDREKRELPVSPLHTASELLLSKDSTGPYLEASTDVYGVKKVKSFTSVPPLPKGQVSEDKSSAAELLEKKRVRETPENVATDSSFSEGVTKPVQSKQLHAVDRGSEDRCKLGSTSGSAVLNSSGPSDIFKGKSFFFSSSFPIDRRPQIIEWIQQGGGVVVDDPGKMNADFVVERHGLLQFPVDLSQSTVVSTHWIRSSLEVGCMQDVRNHILYSPLRCHIPLPGFEGLRFCVSQYEEKDRLLLRNLCYTLGAKFTEKLTKKVTHLLCKFTNGPKYEAACNWGIQSVTAEWITECITRDMVIPPDSFLPRPVTTQDRELGVCTVSQHPTQAARMISGYVPSQLLSEPQAPKEDSDASENGKRIKLWECDSKGDASAKNRIHQDVRGGSDVVPDVADAIEDLLAQSNKIQDLKSPGTSGCDRGILSPDHSIFGKDHVNSHTDFGITWVTSRSQKQDTNIISNSKVHGGSRGTYYAFSETQTDSQVVGYEEDLSGRQKIIDRVRSQSMTLTPDVTPDK